MDYKESIDFVWSLVNYETNPPQSSDAYSLDRMFNLLNRLENPQDKIKVIHIAGTKGKGSTTAIINSLLISHGFKTGCYISPHLYSPRERITISGNLISKNDFTDMVNFIYEKSKDLVDLTSFEFLTAIAFLYFWKSQVDYAILEVGLGGRLDATNTIKTAMASIITPISFDHMNILGSTLADIALEKAGIIKTGVPLIISKQNNIAKSAILSVVQDEKSKVYYVPDIISTKRKELSLKGQLFNLDIDKGKFPDRMIPGRMDNLYIPLHGHHQIENASTAITALCALSNEIVLNTKQLRDGLANTKWPCRTEIVSVSPFVMIDGAHNDDSARALSRTLRELKDENIISWDNLTLVLGISRDKMPDAILQSLLYLIDNLIITQAKNPRAAYANDINERLNNYHKRTSIPLPPTYLYSSSDEAISKALYLAGDTGAIVITGSLFLAAETRLAFINDFVE